MCSAMYFWKTVPKRMYSAATYRLEEGKGDYCNYLKASWCGRMVVYRWLNYRKCLEILLLKICLESCSDTAKIKSFSQRVREPKVIIPPGQSWSFSLEPQRHGCGSPDGGEQCFLLRTGPIAFNQVSLHRTYQIFFFITHSWRLISAKWRCTNSHWWFIQGVTREDQTLGRWSWHEESWV